MTYTATTRLKQEHQRHLLDEGFSLEQIAHWEKFGLRTIDQQEAADLKLQYWTGDGWKYAKGLYFPFTESFGQIRLDQPITRANGKTAKYLTPYQAKSEAWIPDGCRVVTEGAKDANAGTVHGGIPTGAIAGVSHYRKALEQNAGYTILFDADGWTNPSVFANLVMAGVWLKGKVVILPSMPEHPKGGLCEYFQWLEHLAQEQNIKDVAGFKWQEYQKLIDTAMSPEQMLFEWVGKINGLPFHQLNKAIRVLMRLAAKILDKPNQNKLINVLRPKIKWNKKDIEKVLRKELNKQKNLRTKEAKRSLKIKQNHQSSPGGKLTQKLAHALDLAQQVTPPDETELDDLWAFLAKAPDSLEKEVALRELAQKWGNIIFPRSKYKQAAKGLKRLYGGQLRFNELKLTIEHEGVPLDLDFVRHEICSALDKDITQQDIHSILLGLANERRYSPVAEYLEQVSEQFEDDNQLNLDTLADYLFKLKNPTEQNKRLARTYLKRHLIASVARAFSPGCKADTAFILQGNQGLGKSEFFGTLYFQEKDWFNDSMSDASDKDELLKLHQHWCVEWAELEVAFGRKGNSKLKGFLSTKTDNFRVPYGRQTKSYPRHSVIVGSTNEAEFLTDSSGDRRFWILAVEAINIQLLRELRDRVWAAAVKAYRAGEQWWLTRSEGLLHDEANKPFRMSDPWEAPIQAHIEQYNLEEVTINDLLNNSIDMEISHQGRGDQMRVANILRQMGWEKGQRITIGGKKQQLWCSPTPDIPDIPGHTSNSKVCPPSNNGTATVSGTPDIPDIPLDQTFLEQDQKNPELDPDPTKKNVEAGESLKTGMSTGQVCPDSNNGTATVSVPDIPFTERYVQGEAVEIDYSSYPHLTCDTIEAKRNQSHKIKQRLLEADSKEELTAVRREYSTRCDWVWNNLLSLSEREGLKMIAKTEQLDLQLQPTPTPDAPIQKLDSPICQRINAEMKRLGWTKQQGRDCLTQTYGKSSRQLLSDEELLDFLHHLESIEEEF